MTLMYLQKLDTPEGNVLISYELLNLTKFSIKYDMGITTNPLPENADDETVLVKVTGNSTTQTVGWVIKNDGTNRASGSGVQGNTSTKTMFEQLRFFDKVFQAIHLGDAYRLVIADGFTLGNIPTGGSTPDAYTNEYFRKEGALSGMSFDFTDLEPVNIRASVDFQTGRVVSGLDADTPSEPLSITKSDIGSHHVLLGWATPNDAGGSAITGYVIQRKTQTTAYVDVITTGVTNSATDTSITVAGHYYYRIAAISSIGRGLYSDEVDLDVA